jgi:hypothetical protein
VDSLIQQKKFASISRLVQSAPTSNNGSNNPNPVLDIQVSLPVGEVISEDVDTNYKNERR